MGKIPITKVTLGKVTTDSGVVCKNPIVKLIGHPNVYIRCIDTAKGVYELQLPENEDLKCLEFSVDCNSAGDCRNCEPERITKCFCDDAGDCPDCNRCVNGVCEPLCPENLCLNGSCVACTQDAQCPCDQICINGSCVCPPGEQLCSANSECCKECCDSNDCPACYICQGGDCIPALCPGDEVCDPSTETCVECVTNDQCGDNECCQPDNTCDCCEGFTRDNCTGLCVPLSPNACSTTEDCPDCFECTNYNECTGLGVCTPKQCPDGTICVGDQCIEECDCSDPDCSEATDYCKDFGNAGCGCVDCEGSCPDGCVDPCYCNPQTSQCEENPCANVACTNGLDCGEGCGCDEDEGLCKPCSTLSCATNECDEVLGCECSGNNCVGSGCPPTGCSVGADCPLGCTCVAGECVSCDNFSCSTDECSEQDGCICTGGTCQGDPESECSDVLSISKNDSNCTLKGRLVKDNCCQCPQMTLDSKGQFISENSQSVTLNFLAEVRKGAFDGVDVNSVPRVDDFSNDNIAENEPPTSGNIQLSTRITYAVYDVSTGTRIYQGDTVTSPTSQTSGFAGTGTTAQVNFNGVSLPKIGSETQDGNTIRVVKEVEVSFALTNTLQFPNDCGYKGGTFATYTFSTNSALTGFSSTSFGNAKGDIISTTDCRKPFFRWTKSQDSNFNESPFRKIYVDGGPFVYEDILTKENGLESCYYYSLESDCSCDEPKSQYVVFCNPENLDFTVSPSICPKCLTINSFDPCEVNENLTYRVEAGGGIDFTFKGNAAPIGQLQCGAKEIEQVKFSIECDVEGQCDKVYTVNQSDLDVDFTTECDPSNQQFTVTFEGTDTTGACAVEKVEIAGSTLTGVLSKTLDVGEYNALVYFQCGCDPISKFVKQDCCDFILPPCVRNCNGAVDCEQDPSVQYTVGGAVVDDVVSLIESLPNDQTLNIVATKEDCLPINIVIPSLTSFCCEDFSLSINQVGNTYTVVVNGGTEDITAIATNNTQGGLATVEKVNNNTFIVSGFVEGDNLTITVTDPICGSEDGNVIAGVCDLVVNIEEFIESGNCRLRASTGEETCECKQGSYVVTITDIDVDLDASTMDISFKTQLSGFDSEVVGGDLFTGPPGNLTSEGYVTGSDVITVPLETLTSDECISSQTRVDIYESCPVNCNFPCNNSDDCPEACICSTETNGEGSSGGFDGDCLCTAPGGDVEIRLSQGSGDIKDADGVTAVVVTIDGNVASESDGVYSVSNVASIGNDLTIVTTVTKDGTNFTDTFTYPVEASSGGSIESSQLFAQSLCAQITSQSQSTAVEFDLRNLELADGCTYPDVSVVIETFQNGTTVPPTPQYLQLLPDPSATREVKFTWIRDSSQVFVDFAGEDENYTSTLPLSYTTVGSNYQVVAECLPCNDSDSQKLCCLPDADIEVTGCNDNMNVTLSGNAGDFVLIYKEVQYNVTVPVFGAEVTTVIPGPIDSGVITLQLETSSSCTEEIAVPLVSPCVPTFLTECTGGLLYNLTVNNCGGVVTMVILEGSGTVLGNQIVNITEGLPPKFRLTDENGCVQIVESTETGPDPSCSETYTPTYQDTYAPTYTPRAMYNPNYTPNYSVYTPTYTPSYVVYAPDYSPLYAQYQPTYTPLYATYAPSYIPNGTPGYTPDYTPLYAAYQPTYTPNYVVYTPNYAPNYAQYTPNYAPNYAQYQPTYTPNYVEYQPNYTPIYGEYTPNYAPNYAPIYAQYTPSFTYIPSYTPHPYTPSYSPIYTPTGGGGTECVGCTGESGTCCNEIGTEPSCNAASDCSWNGMSCDCGSGTPTYTPSYVQNPCCIDGCNRSGGPDCCAIPTEAVCNTQGCCDWTGSACICTCENCPQDS